MTTHEENLARVARGVQNRRRRYRLVAAVLALLAVLLCGVMMIYGNTLYSFRTVAQVLGGAELGTASFTIRTLRWPRMLAGLTAGFAFGLSGSVFQTMLRNPLANPNIIGITSASSAGAVFCILILHVGGAVVFGSSIACAVVTALLIYWLASRRRYSTGRLILVGIGFQAVMNSIISYLLLIGNENDIGSAMRWMSGSLNGVQIESIYPLFAAAAVCVPFILIYSRTLKVLELGDESAVTMGVRADRSRKILMIASVALVAVATATTGPISFVAFLAAPIARRITGYGDSSPLPAGLFGAVLVLGADLVGQYAFEIRFPVGVITGLLGAPYLIYLLIHMNQRGEL